MPHRIIALFAVFAVFALSACGSDYATPPATPTPAPTVSSIVVTSSSADPIVSLGDIRTLTAVARDAAGATIAVPNLTWSSSAPAVATVAGSGSTATVTSVGNGTATITATVGAVQGVASVQVAQRAVRVVVTGASSSVSPGAIVQLTSQARNARDGEVANVSGFTYTSSDPGVAAVNATGVVTGIAPGTAAVTVSAITNGSTVTGSAPFTVAFTVTAPLFAEVAATIADIFTPNAVTIAPGGSVAWNFGTSTHNVTFQSSGAPANVPNTSSSSVSRTFITAGTFPYVCTLHAGMNGTVVVQASGNAPNFTALLNGANERPTAAATQGNGAASFTVTGGTVSYVITFARLTNAPTMAHLHGAGNASQVAGVLVNFPVTGQTSNTGVLTGSFTAADIRGAGGQPPISIDSVFTLMRTSHAYVNVHTAQFPGGEIRGQTVPRP